MEDRVGPFHCARVKVGLFASDNYPGTVIAHGQLLAVIPIVTTVVHDHHGHGFGAIGIKSDLVYYYERDTAMCFPTMLVRC